MNDEAPHIHCKHCHATQSPDLKARGPWVCAECGRKNPNLRRHYRSVADLYILGLIATGIGLLIGIRIRAPVVGLFLGGLQAVLLVITIVRVYKSPTPWTDPTGRILIWGVLAFAVFFNVLAPLIVFGRLNPVFLLVYGIIFWYLLWLGGQTRNQAS